MKTLRYLLYALVILGAGGLLAYEALIEKNLDSANVIKCGLIIAAAVLGMVKAPKSRIVNKKAVYQKAYNEFIQGAFQEEPKLERQFYNAIHDYNQDKYSHAIAKLEKLRKECHRSKEICAVSIFMGLCWDDMGMYPHAAQYYADALRMRPNASIASNLGLCYQRMGKTEEAEDCYRQSIAMDSQYAIGYNNLSVLYFRKADYREALDLARQAIAIDNNFAQALSTAALCCGLLGDREGYDQYYHLAVSNGYDGQRIIATLNRMRAEAAELSME